MAYRTRLPGAQAGTRARALRGPRLARFPPSRHALHRSLWLPGRRTGEDSPLRICRPEAQSDWPSHGLSTPRRLRSDRSGTSRTQSPPCGGGSPWPWPKASSDVRAAQPTSAGLRTIPARDAVVLGPVNIEDSPGWRVMLQAPLWRGWGDACEVSAHGGGRGLGEDRSAVARQGLRSWGDGQRQSAVPGGGAVACANGRALARPAERFRSLEQRLPAISPLGEGRRLRARLRRPVR